MTELSDFFGLKHPVVKNLLQCSQGAGGCLGYIWCKYEVAKDSSSVDSVPSELDPTNSFESIVQLLKRQPGLHFTADEEKSGNSRQLIRNGIFSITLVSCNGQMVLQVINHDGLLGSFRAMPCSQCL